jgi:hypothetical protein
MSCRWAVGVAIHPQATGEHAAAGTAAEAAQHSTYHVQQQVLFIICVPLTHTISL